MLTFMSGICPRGPDLGHPKWWREEEGKWGNFLFRRDQWGGGCMEVFEKRIDNYKQVFLCIKASTIPEGNKTRVENAQTDKAEYFLGWSCSSSGGGGGGTRQGGENRWGFVWLSFWGRSVSGILSRSASRSLRGGSVYRVETCCRLSVGWQTGRKGRREPEEVEEGEEEECNGEKRTSLSKKAEFRWD